MPISQRPAPIDAFHEEAEVAICASLAVFIFFVHSIAGRSAALKFGFGWLFGYIRKNSTEFRPSARKHSLHRSKHALDGCSSLSSIFLIDKTST
jgi:hypothetical protein